MLKKFNFFDWLVVFLVVLFLVLLGLSWYLPKKTLSGKANLTVAVTENKDAISRAVIPGDTVYLNGSNAGAKVVSATQNGQSLLITIEAPAAENGEVYNFNGQRVLIGQKAELHGRFFAQGRVTAFDYHE